MSMTTRHVPDSEGDACASHRRTTATSSSIDGRSSGPRPRSQVCRRTSVGGCRGLTISKIAARLRGTTTPKTEDGLEVRSTQTGKDVCRKTWRLGQGPGVDLMTAGWGPSRATFGVLGRCWLGAGRSDARAPQPVRPRLARLAAVEIAPTSFVQSPDLSSRVL